MLAQWMNVATKAARSPLLAIAALSLLVGNAEAMTCGGIFEMSKAEIEAQIARLRQDVRLPVHIEDMRNFQLLRRIKQAGAVTIAVGNHTQFNRRANLEQYAQLARAAAESGRYVIYDADASTADTIRAAAGDRAVGVSANAAVDQTKGRIIHIHNMNMRLDGFGEDVIAVASIDSMVGMGLVLHRKARWLIDTNGTWRQQLAEWTRRLNADGWNLGIKFKDIPVLRTPTQLELPPITSARVEEREASTEELKEIAAHAVAVQSLMDSGGVAPGTVVFGSAQVDPRSAEDVYRVSYALGSLGVTGTSGGAGGAMWLANSGFYDAGARSVGVPIAGRNQLDAEKKVRVEVQTATAGSPNYHVRVYGLLTGKSMAVNVPGGGGTMREIAATLVMMAPEPTRGPTVAFVKPEYYRELTDLLSSLPLPRSFRNRLVASMTADNAAEVAANAGAVPRDGQRPLPRAENAGFDLNRFMGSGEAGSGD